MKEYALWKNSESDTTTIECYAPPYKSSDAAVVILPGGAYARHADYEGVGYAQVFNAYGMTAFVLKYRVYPFHFPKPLLDARRAMRFIRAHAEDFGIDKNKILVIGSSAGGHLAALLSTYREDLDGEAFDDVDNESYLPNGQILCYPVISSEDDIGHIGSYQNLLGDNFQQREKFSPDKLVDNDTPKAFIWHTSTDSIVNVINSYHYAEALARHKVNCELHVFPIGEHGCGVGAGVPYVSKWIDLLRQWLILNKFIGS